MRRRVGVDVRGVGSTCQVLVLIHLFESPGRLLRVVGVLIRHEHREWLILDLLESLDGDVRSHVRTVVVVDVLRPLLVVEFHAVQEVVVALVADEVGEVRTQLGRDGDVALVTEVPLADPAGPYAAIVQRSS